MITLLLICLLTYSTNWCTTSPADIIDHFQTQQIQFVNFLFTDITGALREVTIPISRVSNAFEYGLTFDGSSIPGCVDVCASDMLMKPDVSTARITPWLLGINKSGVIMCDVYEEFKRKYNGAPRQILKRALDEAETMGYKFVVGAEIEFFLLKKDSTEFIDNKTYCLAETNAQHFIQKSSMLHLLTAFGIDAEKIHHEVASGQHEISIKYGNALDIADQIMLVKYTLQTIAHEYGYKVLFMPKPRKNQNGSAMHIHFSLWNRFEYKNEFYNGTNYELSRIGKQFVAGVLNHMPELTAIFNPTVNSYKRLVPGYEAPTYICWGTKNRSALIRVPLAFHENNVRAELRSPDVMCNPYIAFAALLKAGLEGVKNNYPLVSAVEQNIYRCNQQECAELNIASLPHSLEEAINIMKNSSLALDIMGQKSFDQYIALKTAEIRDYNTHISDWELEHYA